MTISDITPTMSVMADPIPLPDLAKRITALRKLGDVAAIREAAELSDVALASLQAYGDQRAFDATRARPNADVAAELETTKSALEKRITRHRRRTTG